MSEHAAADPTDLDAREAAQTIGRLQDVDDALVRRTAGVTWMIWGLVAPAIFVTYAAFGEPIRGSRIAFLEGFLWAPWTLLGALATSAAWETAGTALPGLRGYDARRAAVGLLVFLVPIFAALAVADLVGAPAGVVEDVAVLAGLGGGALAAGATGLVAPDQASRRLFLAGGAFLLAVAAGSLYVLAGVPLEVAYDLAPAIAAIASAVAFFTPGILLTRGG